MIYTIDGFEIKVKIAKMFVKITKIQGPDFEMKKINKK